MYYTLEKSVLLHKIYKKYIEKYFYCEKLYIGKDACTFKSFKFNESKTFMKYIEEDGLGKYFKINKRHCTYKLKFRKYLDDSIIGLLRIKGIL